MCLATTAYVYTQLRIHVTIISNGSIIPTGFKFTELHALTLAARSCVLLLLIYMKLSIFMQHCPVIMICLLVVAREPIVEIKF